MNLQLGGIHHVSAITARISGNHAFYTRVMGLRLVKKSVNQDDPSMYHLFYADAQATPGSDLTFFDIPRAAPEHRGNRSISRTFLRVSGQAALEYWAARLEDNYVAHGPLHLRDGRLTLDFEDPEGLPLSLVDDGGRGEAYPWKGSDVPAEYQIRGLGPVMLTVPELHPTARVLTDLLNMRRVRAYVHPDDTTAQVHVFEMGEGGAGAEVHVAVRPDLPRTYPGAGGVHHVAFRVPSEEQYHAWARHLEAAGVHTSGEVDRYYFRALYFREPQGILFELSTDGPGFATDEPLEALGERLALPPFLESRRAEIEAKLRPL
ncbi:glyoxalase family protein [Deinobacterium chartae]|uniref:Glyoxalase family protein n=1 Tax=Deinobacterium chartae TaxID=521158 RepID=A0A841HTQ4_9DEIO|nr:ring-cleaving dioxygenase [Deinobacterium chartae]MBB6096801.1 glyoxalase family protein [Deinobacterium chartae]